MLGTILNFLNRWQVKVAILVLILISLFSWHKIEVNKAVTSAIAEIHIQQTKENFRLKEHSLDAKIALQESFDKIQKEKDAKILSLNSRVVSLTSSLQSRPSRAESGGVSNDSRNEEVRPEGTGIGLYREDSVFLSGEAARAELIKEELLTCYRRYDTAKETLDKFKRENTPRTP